MQFSLFLHHSHLQSAITWVIVLSLALLSLSARAEGLIVTDRQHPVQSVTNARIIKLDEPGRIEADLAANLPSIPDEAAATVQQPPPARRRPAATPPQPRMAGRGRGLRAGGWGLGIATIPAVVVDRHYVVYGDPDVAGAVAHIDAFRRAQP